jgi:hypothetical protein
LAMQRSRFGRPILTGATGIPATPTLHRWSDEGSAILTTDSEGRYRFKTIKPAAYLVGPNFIRPAHIHFQVSDRQDRLLMYVENDPHNDKDTFLNSIGSLKERLITKLLDPLQSSSRTQKWRSSTSFCAKGSLERLRFVVDHAFTRVTACTLALSPIRDTHSELSHWRARARARFPKTLNQQLRV